MARQLYYQVYDKRDKVSHRAREYVDAIIVLHGLLGTGSNLGSVARALSETHRVYLVDQRNHGKSFHDADCSYLTMVEDVLHLWQQCNISKAHLLGHSMGGKTAMAFALLYPDKVQKLVVGDIVPKQYEPQHDLLFKIMSELNLLTLTNRGEAFTSFYEAHIHSDKLISFLLKNLAYDSKTKTYYWQCALSYLKEGISVLQSFPALNAFPLAPNKVEALFVSGEKSDYFIDADKDCVREYFPNACFSEIKDANHWLHVDQPKAFIEVVKNFFCRAGVSSQQEKT